MRNWLRLIPLVAVLAVAGCDPDAPPDPRAPTPNEPRDPYAPAPMSAPPSTSRTSSNSGDTAQRLANLEIRIAKLEAQSNEALKLLYDNTIASDARSKALLARLDALSAQMAAAPAQAPAIPVAPAPTPTPIAPAAPAAEALKAPEWTDDQKKWIGKYTARFEGSAPSAVGVQENDLIGNRLPQTRFLSVTGDVLDLKDFAKQKKKVVLIVLRGFSGSICLYCSSQTLALSRAAEDFKKANAEVILVYPGKAETVPMFLEAVDKLDPKTKVPFAIAMDVDLSAVHLFRIRGELAKPTSLVLDETGVVRYAYVGKDPTDRPSVKELLAELAKTPAQP